MHGAVSVTFGENSNHFPLQDEDTFETLKAKIIKHYERELTGKPRLIYRINEVDLPLSNQAELEEAMASAAGDGPTILMAELFEDQVEVRCEDEEWQVLTVRGEAPVMPTVSLPRKGKKAEEEQDFLMKAGAAAAATPTAEETRAAAVEAQRLQQEQQQQQQLREEEDQRAREAERLREEERLRAEQAQAALQVRRQQEQAAAEAQRRLEEEQATAAAAEALRRQAMEEEEEQQRRLQEEYARLQREGELRQQQENEAAAAAHAALREQMKRQEEELERQKEEMQKVLQLQKEEMEKQLKEQLEQMLMQKEAMKQQEEEIRRMAQATEEARRVLEQQRREADEAEKERQMAVERERERIAEAEKAEKARLDEIETQRREAEERRVMEACRAEELRQARLRLDAEEHARVAALRVQAEATQLHQREQRLLAEKERERVLRAEEEERQEQAKRAIAEEMQRLQDEADERARQEEDDRQTAAIELAMRAQEAHRASAIAATADTSLSPHIFPTGSQPSFQVQPQQPFSPPHVHPQSALRISFVRDETIEDGTVLHAGTHFEKVWRFHNNSTVPIPEGTRMVQMENPANFEGPTEICVQNEVAPGADFLMRVTMVAPFAYGQWKVVWTFVDVYDQPLSNKVWISITTVPAVRIAFVRDVTVEDGTMVACGEPIDKVWEFRNLSTVPTPEGLMLIQREATHGFEAPTQVRVPAGIAPNQSFQLTVAMRAPPTEGEARIHWVFVDGNRVEASKQVWVVVQVRSPLAMLREIGFTHDEAALMEALRAADGRIATAVNILAQSAMISQGGQTPPVSVRGPGAAAPPAAAPPAALPPRVPAVGGEEQHAAKVQNILAVVGSSVTVARVMNALQRAQGDEQQAIELILDEPEPEPQPGIVAPPPPPAAVAAPTVAPSAATLTDQQLIDTFSFLGISDVTRLRAAMRAANNDVNLAASHLM